MALTSAMHAQDTSKPHDKPKSSGSQETHYVRPTDPALYVGPDTCKTCHEELYNGFAGSPHFATTMDSKLDSHKGPEWHGCEACHGPGKEHVDGGGDVTKIFTFKDASPAQISARCLDCHQSSHEQDNYGRSAHLQSGISCIDCHSPHHAKESQYLLKEASPKLCYSCHLDVRAQFARP
jgi:DmsE family decaheme c-type cytochrome